MPALQRAASSTACGAPLPAARHAAFLPFRAANARTVSTKAADKQSAVAAAPKTSKAKANGATATPKVQNAAPAHTATSSTVFHYFQLEIDTAPCKGVGLFDITPEIRAELAKTGITEGVVNVVSRHTTTAVIINESEPRLLDDIRQWLHRVASPSHPYLHNDMHLREAPKDWCDKSSRLRRGPSYYPFRAASCLEFVHVPFFCTLVQG